MTTADQEERKRFWRRHLGVLILGGFALLLAMIVIRQLLEEGDIAHWLADPPEEWAYPLCFPLVWVDAIIPIFPGETTLSAASTLAAQGRRPRARLHHAGRCARRDRRGLVALLDRSQESPIRVQDQLDAALGKSQGSRSAGTSLDRSPGLVDRRRTLRPGDALRRQRVNGALGPSRTAASCPGRSSAESLWSVYTCALAYKVATHALRLPASVSSSSPRSSRLPRSAAILLRRLARRRRAVSGAESTDVSAEPAVSAELRRIRRRREQSGWIRHFLGAGSARHGVASLAGYALFDSACRRRSCCSCSRSPAGLVLTMLADTR